MTADKTPETIKDNFESSTNKFVKVPLDMARDFFKLEAAGGIVLVIASAIALIVANSPLYGSYDYFLNQMIFTLGFSDAGGEILQIHKPVHLWINDGLMAVFFFLVGLEIKRELIEGQLSSVSKATLPAIAAVGGMAVPALFYVYFNMDSPENIRGWAIPAATDIAFALGVLSLLGNRIPVALKALLLGIAVIDDIGAILVIAIFFSENISFQALTVAFVAFAALAALNVRGVSKLAPYILLAFILWVAVLKSGIHATLAGVVAAMFIPLSCKDDPQFSPCKHLEHSLHPWVAFMVLPIFGFANAGVPFEGMGWHSLTEPVTLGIIMGLFVGKQIGIFGLMWVVIKLGIVPKPYATNWMQLYGVSLLCGIGFTMSLFIGGLAFTDIEMQASVRLGVLVGSLLSATLGYAMLYYAPSSSKSYDQPTQGS